MLNNITFEEIKRQSAGLDFVLEYRVALVNGRILENQNISNDVFRWLERVCQLYLETDECVRSQIRGLFDNDDKLWYLFMFIGKLERTIKSRGDAAILEKALIALSIEDARFDQRDFCLRMSTLLRTGRNAGIETEDIFSRIGALSSVTTREYFTRILER